MFSLMRTLIGYTGSNYSNIDQYVLYAVICFILLFFVVLFDMLYRLLRSFIRK